MPSSGRAAVRATTRNNFTCTLHVLHTHPRKGRGGGGAVLGVNYAEESRSNMMSNENGLHPVALYNKRRASGVQGEAPVYDRQRKREDRVRHQITTLII